MVASSKGMQGQYAGFISRIVAFMADQLIIVGVIALVNGVIALSLELFLGVDVSNCPVPKLDGVLQWGVLCSVANWLRLFLSLAITPVYFALFWTLGGQTLGQYAMGLRVVRLDGRRMNVWRSLLRWVGYLASFISFGLGFLWVLWDDRRQGWADKLARTVVIYAWEARQNEFLLDRLRSRWRAQRRKLLPVQPTPAAAAAPARLELVLTVMPSMARVRATMNVLQDALRQQRIAIVNTLVFVKDETGAFGFVGASDLVSGGDEIMTNQLLDRDPRLRQIKPEELVADVPDGSFVLLILVEDKQLTPLLKTLTNARIAAHIFDLDLPAHPPVMMTPDPRPSDAISTRHPAQPVQPDAAGAAAGSVEEADGSLASWLTGSG